MNSLSGSVPSRHLFGAAAVYYRGSQYSIVHKLFLGKSLPLPPAFQRSLWTRIPPVSSLSGSVPSRHLFWRCNGLLPEVSPVFDRAETILGEIVSTSARLPEVYLKVRPPREFYLRFGTTKASFWLYQTTTGSLSSFRSYRSYSWGNLSHIRQPSRGLSESASPS